MCREKIKYIIIIVRESLDVTGFLCFLESCIKHFNRMPNRWYKSRFLTYARKFSSQSPIVRLQTRTRAHAQYVYRVTKKTVNDCDQSNPRLRSSCNIILCRSQYFFYVIVLSLGPGNGEKIPEKQWPRYLLKYRLKDEIYRSCIFILIDTSVVKMCKTDMTK